MEPKTAGIDKASEAHNSFEELYVGPYCHVQTAENRFGPEVLDDLKTFVHATPMAYTELAEEGNATDEDEEDEDDDEQFAEDFEPFTFHEGEALFGDGLDNPPDHAPHGFPRIATTRNNLTALSQRYNLYFAAYQDRIYVYQPRRTGPQILPSPSLILHPRRSKLAEKADAAALDFQFPHQINHIIVGDLGDLEIVLFSYDDGDVAAYYTHAIVRCIEANQHQRGDVVLPPSRHQAQPKLFFHENVLKSAWGLAIHEQSRLIAVGSNLYEVTVFAFALDHSRFTAEFVGDNAATEPTTEAWEMQKRFQSRTRTWRIVLPLGRFGSNIPNLTFIDDDRGDAEKVAAIDIAGSVWFLDIWTRAPPVRWPVPFWGERQIMPEGWGVLVLPYSAFTPVRTAREALGVPIGEVFTLTTHDEHKKVWLDTTCGLYYINGFALNPNVTLRQRISRFDYAHTHVARPDYYEEDLTEIECEPEVDDDDDNDDDDDGDGDGDGDDDDGDDTFMAQRATAFDGPDSTKTKGSSTVGPFSDPAGDVRMSQCIIPHLDEIPQLHSISDYVLFGRLPARRDRVEHIEISQTDLPAHFVKNHCLIRTTQTNFELQTFDPSTPSIECKYLLTRDPHRPGGGTPWDLHPAYSERISMLLHVPELSLVVAGSPTGRVALITLTRTSKQLCSTKLRYGFRVECVLPRKVEDEKRLRPRCTMVGVAISPAPYRPGRSLRLRPNTEARAGSLPAVYRLILHYKDHTILMYELARGRDREELLVF